MRDSVLAAGSGFFQGHFGRVHRVEFRDFEKVVLDHDFVQFVGIPFNGLVVSLETGMDGQVTEEERPLTLNVLKQTQLPGLVVKSARILAWVLVAVTEKSVEESKKRS